MFSATRGCEIMTRYIIVKIIDIFTDQVSSGGRFPADGIANVMDMVLPNLIINLSW
jgi:hypothetical protein